MLARTALAVLALAALPALATEGFFRSQESPAHERPDAAQQADTAPPIPCALVIRYNVARVGAQEITFEGQQSACLGSYQTALAQALQAAPKELNDPLGAGAPPRDCAIVVNFFAGVPMPPTTTLIGGGACPSTLRAALTAAQCALAPNVICPAG